MRNDFCVLQSGALQINTENNGLVEIVREQDSVIFSGFINNSDKVFDIDVKDARILYTNGEIDNNTVKLSKYSFLLIERNE